MYRAYRIRKPRGGFRTITEPAPALKQLLCKLKEELDAIPLHDAAHGFVPGRSPKTNASVHRCKPYVLNVDLKDFFPSVTKEKMMTKLKATAFDKSLLPWVEAACFHEGALPQGSPTSPVLSNIYMTELDSVFSDLASTQHWDYTRYADDITFSGGVNLKEVMKSLLVFMGNRLKAKGLKINPKKVKITSRSQCQRVTGIVVNNQKLTLKGREREALFQSLRGVSYESLDESERGYLEYVRSVDPKFYEKLCRYMIMKH